MKIVIRMVHSTKDERAVLHIRRQVFIEEQHVPEEMEIDEHEAEAEYVLAFYEGVPVGTARWRETKKGMKLERFAVLPQYRGLGLGAALVSFVLKQLENRAVIYLNAQEPVIEFYKKYGFYEAGKRFYEVGIPHKKMVYDRET